MSIGNIIALFILAIYLLMVIRVFINENKYYKRKKKYKVVLEELGKLIKVEEEE